LKKKGESGKQSQSRRRKRLLRIRDYLTEGRAARGRMETRMGRGSERKKEELWSILLQQKKEKITGRVNSRRGHVRGSY